jgi:hypothetical protein
MSDDYNYYYVHDNLTTTTTTTNKSYSTIIEDKEENINARIYSILDIFYLIFSISICILTNLLNILLIIIILKLTNKSTYSNILFLSTVIAYSMVGAFSMPFTIKQFYDEEWPGSNLSLCKYWMITDYSSFLASTLSVLILAIHRYRQLTKPVSRLNENLTITRSILIFSAWLVSYLFWGLMLIPISDQDIIVYTDYFKIATPYVIIETIMLNLPFMLVLIVNIMIVVELKKRIGKTANIILKSNVSSSSDRIISKRQHGKSLKAFVCLSSITLALVVCNGAFSFAFFMRVICDDCISEFLWSLIVWINYLNSPINAALLLTFNENFKNELNKFINLILKKLFFF